MDSLILIRVEWEANSVQPQTWASVPVSHKNDDTQTGAFPAYWKNQKMKIQIQ